MGKGDFIAEELLMECIKCKKDIPEGSLFCNWCGSKQVKEKNKRRRGNGEGSVYLRGKTYVAQKSKWICGERKLIRKGGFRTKREALEWLKNDNTDTNKKTFDRIYKEWYSVYIGKISETKMKGYQKARERIDSVCYTDIRELTIGQLQCLIEGLNYYPARDIKHLLSHLYKRAMAECIVPTNLSTFIELPELIEEEREAFNEEEVSKLWEGFGNGDRNCAYYLLMIYTGMMPGELFKARVSMIDWGNQKITGAGLKTKERKTKPIIIPDIVIPVLQFLAEDTDFICTEPEHVFYKDSHALSGKYGIRDLPVYSCRHTTASALANADKVAPISITRIMRQKNVRITERYKHAEEQNVLKQMNETFSTAHN